MVAGAMVDFRPLDDSPRLPAEWEPHLTCWTAYPHNGELWGDNLAMAQAEFAGLVAALAPSEPVTVLVPDARVAAQAETALRPRHPGLRVVEHPYGDIWLRDTGPIFVQRQGRTEASRFHFNGWGKRYELPHDAEVAAGIAQHSGTPPGTLHAWVLEGGSIDVDGEGTLLTTRQCLLNRNRNPNLQQPHLEELLGEAFGIRRVLWLDDGLINDHTDGHVDTLARFVAPGEVVCMAASGADDPNARALGQIAEQLHQHQDAAGRRLRVHTIPSPGCMLDRRGEPMPASYVNFYIGNGVVVVPIYGSPYDAAAVAALQPLFPGRRVIGCRARAILDGGGAFHCITQQQPRDRS